MAANKVEKLTREQLRKIWTRLTLADWLSILQEFKPDHGWSIQGDELFGCCLYHSEKTPSFHIAPEKGFAYCFGGSCKHYEHDPLRLLATVMNIGVHQVVRQLKNRYGVSFASAYTSNIAKFEENDRVKAALYQVMNLEFRDALANPTAPEFDYINNSGLVPWFKQRHIPEDTVHQWPVGVMPTRERLYQRLGDEEQIAGGEALRDPAYRYLEKYLAMPNEHPKCEGWLAFFYFTSPTTIGRIKLRKPSPGHDFRIVEDPYDDEVGFFGLNMFPELRPMFSKTTLHVTEGDFDVLAPIAHQMSRGVSDLFIVGSGGSMVDELDHLKDFGFKDIRLLQDADEGGVGRAKAWLTNNTGVSGIFKWQEDDTAKGVKDIDEAIRAYAFKEFFTRLLDDKSYEHNHEWAARQLTEELSKLPSGDAQARTDKAIEYGRTLKNEAERNAFVEIAVQDHGIDKQLVVKDLAPDDTESGFVTRLANALEDDYLFLAIDNQDGRSTRVTAWSKGRRMLQFLPTDSPVKLDAALCMDLGPLFTYTQQKTGIPEFMLTKMAGKREAPTTELEQEQKLQMYYTRAVKQITKGLRARSRMEDVGQGVHFLPEENDEDVFKVHIVNGDRFFQGEINNDKIQFKEYTSPLYEKYLFRIAGQPWSQQLKSLKDIESGNDFSPTDIYKKVYQIISTGWKFFNHELESQFIAADIMYTAVAAVFKHMVFVDITGESHSGKSSLMQIIGGNMDPAYRLCELTAVLDNYSAAGVRQFTSNNRLRLILDEFEDTDAGSRRPDNKALAAREILDLIRSASSGASTVRGTATGEAVFGKINFPMTVGGIYTMQRTQDLNRFVHIRTKQVPGCRYPLLTVQKMFSPAEMKQIRRGITLSLLPRIPQLIKTHQSIQKEFEDNQSLAAGTMDRQARNFYPAATILKFVGEDYMKFMQDFSAVKSQELAAFGGTEHEYQRVWNAVLHTTINLSQHSKELQGMAALSTILSNRDFQGILKTTDLGAYFLPDRKWLIIFWQRAISGILRYNNEYRNHQNYHHLKIVADQDPRTIPREKLTPVFLKTEVWPRTGGMAVSPDDISVINLTELLTTMVARSDDMTEPISNDEAERQKMLSDIAADIRPPKRGNF